MDAYEIKKYLSHFKTIYDESGNNEDNPMPEGIKLTVYCEGNDMADRGFIVNATSDELGLEALIARKWIIHDELEKLAGCKVD